MIHRSLGLVRGGEKPAGVRAAFAAAWLPALGAAALAAGGMRALPLVLSGTGARGAVASAGLAAALGLAGAAYVHALRRPPPARITVAAALAAVAVAALSPVLFSADVFAYAYYGDLALHGLNPYVRPPAVLPGPLTPAVVAAWDGRFAPACVYGPLAVALAAVADVAGAPAGSAGQIAAQRVLAFAAYAACLGAGFRVFRDARARAAVALHPAVLWSVAEGHNDAAMLAFVLAAFAARATTLRPWLLALATLVKAPAVLAFAALRAPGTTTAAAMLLAVAGYVPLAVAAAAAPHPAGGADWQSPLGIAAAALGTTGALTLGAAALAATALSVRRLPESERAGAFALAAWYLLPNAYPWYGLWIVPVAARRLDSPWSRALLVAAFCAPARVFADAIFPAGGPLHSEMIAVQYLPPLAVLVLGTTLFAPAPVPAGDQATPVAQPSVTPYVPPPPPTPTATTAPSPSATPSPAASPTPAPSPTATPQNPYAYVVTPPAAAQSAADGPQILDVAMNDRTLRPGGPLLVRVRTTPNVVGVEARALGRFLAIPQNGPGTFVLTGNMPGGIPFFMTGKTYEVVFAAATADGRQTTLTVPIQLAR